MILIHTRYVIFVMMSLMMPPKNIFDQFADFITSIRAVIIALIFLLTFLMIETQTLFNRQLPPDVFPALRILASFAVAITYEFTVLIFTANRHQRGGKIPVVLAIFHFFINCYFWKAWDFADHLNLVDTAYRFFLSGLFSYLGYIYATLFVEKYQERQQELSDISELDQLRSATGELQQKIGELNSQLAELNSDNAQLSSDLSELSSAYNQVSAELNEKRRKLTRKGSAKPVKELSEILNNINGSSVV